MSALALAPVTSRAELRALAPEWRSLWERCPDASPFQAPAWSIPWCDHLGPERLASVALRDRGRLVGLLPMFAWRDGAARALALLGAGVSDRLDALVEPAHRDACAEALADHLEATSDAWDRCDFEQLPETSPLLRMRAPRGAEDACSTGDACPVLRLPATLADLGAVVPREMMRNVRRARARAEALGRLELVTATRESRVALLEAFMALHARRWERAGEAGVLAPPAVRTFHREVSAAFEEAGALRLHAVILDGEVVAALYGFAGHGVVRFYLQGIDPAFERVSPGTLVVAHAIEEAVRAGDREADFLRGQERYKYLWGAVDSPTFRRTFTSRTGHRARPLGPA